VLTLGEPLRLRVHALLKFCACCAGNASGRRKLSEVLSSLEQASRVLQSEAEFLGDVCQGYTSGHFAEEPRLAPAARVITMLQAHVTTCVLYIAYFLDVAWVLACIGARRALGTAAFCCYDRCIS
jgi:hypothetical protein